MKPDFSLGYEHDGEHFGLGLSLGTPPDSFTVRKHDYENNTYEETFYLPERTCQMIEDENMCPSWYCSECGELHDQPPKYCSDCGSRVVSIRLWDGTVDEVDPKIDRLLPTKKRRVPNE